MRYCIDEKVADNKGLKLPELLVALVIRMNVPLETVLDKLEEKEVIVKREDNYFITQHWDEVIDDILLTSNKSNPTDVELKELADEIWNIFPKGKKPGTPYYWKSNKPELILKLKKFYEVYGTQWTDKEILEATKKYVESMQGNPLMRLAKYFIWKKDQNQGDVSELATILENMGCDEEENVNHWTSDLL